MVEQSVGLDVLADFRCQIQLELGQHIDDLVHLIGILIESHQAVLNLGQIVALLKDAGENRGGDEILIPVNLLRLLDEGLPNLGIINHLGHLQILLPLLDVLNDDLLGGVDGESTGGANGPGAGHAPGVDHIVLAGLGRRIVDGEAIGNLHGKGFILVHEAVRITAMNGFQQILTFC